jgi:hypothetical protein
MRHANSNITMNIYTHAGSSKKRQAQSKVVEMIRGFGQSKAADPAGPKFQTRVVSAMRGRREDDRAGRPRSDLEPGPACIRGVAQFGAVTSVAGHRWLDADLPEFTSGSRAEDKNQLTAVSAVAKCMKRRRYEIQIAAYHFFLIRPPGSSGDAGGAARRG